MAEKKPPEADNLVDLEAKWRELQMRELKRKWDSGTLTADEAWHYQHLILAPIVAAMPPVTEAAPPPDPQRERTPSERKWDARFAKDFAKLRRILPAGLALAMRAAE